MSAPGSDAAAKVRRYELGAKLGEGGQGRTYQARDRERNRQVAVKVLELGRGWKEFDLFERECQVLRSLDHPGIPRYRDTYAQEEEGRFYLVMDLVEGVPLSRVLEDHQLLSEAQLWNILHQALEILDYLHGRRPPVIHRDLKPANLIRRPDGSLALVDFGGVRVALRPDGGTTVIGTFGYMAPEQLRGDATPATDLYGLAATLAALGAGMPADRLPHKGLTIQLDEVMTASALRDLLSLMLKPEPDERPPSVAAVREVMARLSAQGTKAAAGATQGRGGVASWWGAGSSGAGAARGAGAPVGAPVGGGAADGGNAAGDARAAGGSRRLRRSRGTPVPPDGATAAGRFLKQMVGSLGYIGLVIIDSVILPLIFAMIGAAWSKRPDKLRRLKQHQETARRIMGSGRQVMKRLAHGGDPYLPLEPGPPPPDALPSAHRKGRGSTEAPPGSPRPRTPAPGPPAPPRPMGGKPPRRWGRRGPRWPRRR